MKLNDIQKKQIEEDLAAFTNEYCSNSKEERKAKGQFFTPASLVIKMLEMFDCEEPGDQTILDPTAGKFAVTFILPSGNELYYSGTSKRDLYKRIFESEEFRQIDAISYNTFDYHFNKGTDWVIENGDKKIIAKFSQDVAEKKTKCTKKVKSLGEIEQELEDFEKEDNCFFESKKRESRLVSPMD